MLYKSILAIIPARKGSKRLPNKNIMKINNKTLVEYAIESALDSKYIDDIVVSTDYNEIKPIINKYRDSCCRIFYHRRPKHLRDNDISTQDVVDDVIHHYKNNYAGYVVLQPTSPLRTSNDIDKGIEIYLSNNYNSVISVVETSLGKYKNNGAVFVFKDKMFPNEKYLYTMSNDKSVDIDTQEDFNIAKELMR